MYVITKEITSFCASHKLECLPLAHPCSRDHGHNYVVKVELRNSTLDGTGFVFDYRGLDGLKKWVDENLDHRNLNKILPFNPTAENLAEFLFKKFQELLGSSSSFLYAVEVSETPKTNARYQQIQ